MMKLSPKMYVLHGWEVSTCGLTLFEIRDVWAHAVSCWVPRSIGMKSGFGNWELNDFPASHAGFVAGPGIQPRSPGSLPTPWAARPVLSSVSRDPREHWHVSKSAGNFTVFCLEWFTFFHLIPTLKISSFLFSPSCPSKTYWICRCGGTH